MRRLGMRFGIMMVCAALTMVGCGGARSSYTPQHNAPGELRWSYADQRLEVFQGDRRVGRVGDWSDLDAAVGCVPEAGVLAASAESSGSFGEVMGMASIATLVGSSAYGVYGVLDDDTDNDLSALAVMGGGLLIGLGLALVAVDQQSSSTRDAVDAVNMYTDRHRSTAACLRRGPLE
ncbi:MAG: hypothetical protein ACE366_18755 [Bradymonadia bacterium]